jgi:hypothetical protein
MAEMDASGKEVEPVGSVKFKHSPWFFIIWMVFQV